MRSLLPRPSLATPLRPLFPTRPRGRRVPPPPAASAPRDGGADDADADADGDVPPPSVDIDALAAALAAAAGARRAAGETVDAEEVGAVDEGGGDDDVDGGFFDDDAVAARRSPAPFDARTASLRAAEVLSEYPDSGFDPDCIELLQELGRVSWSRDGGAPTVAAVAYAARYVPGAPLQSPALVLVKEYAPAATALACNEVQVGVRLSGGALPLRKWHAATGRDGAPRPRPAAVPLLGYFRAAPAQSVDDDGDDGDGDGDGVATWLVFKWEGLQPLSFYPAAEQPPPAGLAALLPRLGGGGGGGGGGDAPGASDRARMVRAVIAGAARALAAVHAAGVAHGSLGGGCVLLSTYTDAQWRRVVVTLDNFGFASMRRPAGGGGGGGGDRPAAAAPPVDADDPVAIAQAADGRALARLTLETALNALGDRGAGDPTVRPTAAAAVDAAEAGGPAAARAVVDAVPAFRGAAAALDAGGGWDFVAALARGDAVGDVAAGAYVAGAGRS